MEACLGRVPGWADVSDGETDFVADYFYLFIWFCFLLHVAFVVRPERKKKKKLVGRILSRAGVKDDRDNHGEFHADLEF